MKRLRLSQTNKMVAGVCGGISNYFGFDPSLVRIIFALLILMSKGSLIIVYLVCWVVIPLDNEIE